MTAAITRLVAAAALVVFACGAQAATRIERVVSPGGIEAWLVQDRSVPLVAMNFAFRGGANQDPPEKPGVAYLTAGLLDEGAGDLDTKAFAERIEQNAVELRFSAQRDNVTGALRVLRDRMDVGFDLLRLALTAPRRSSACARMCWTRCGARPPIRTTSPAVCGGGPRFPIIRTAGPPTARWSRFR